MKPRGEEFMNSIGNDKPGHEMDLELDEDEFIEKIKDETEIDLDWKEVGFVPSDKYKIQNTIKKGGIKKWKNKK